VHVDVGQVEAELAQPVHEGVAARVLAEHQAVRVEADRLGPHDLVVETVLQHAVLVDTGLVREGVVAHDRLVDRDGDAGDLREQASITAPKTSIRYSGSLREASSAENST